MEIINSGKTGIIISKIVGGFGNQLFQFATGYAISQRANLSLELDLEFYKRSDCNRACRLDKLNVKIKEATLSEIIHLKSKPGPSRLLIRVLRKLKINSKYNKRSHFRDASGFKPNKKVKMIKRSCYFEGWGLKPDYFNDYRNDLIQLFKPNFTFSNQYKDILKIVDSQESVSIHIRRKDYIGNSVFKVIDLEYYYHAISWISNNLKQPKYFVFSDDIAWCKEHLRNIQFCTFVESIGENADLEDFFLMKACKHNIIANSSFSWWSAYLNENSKKIVCAPKIWFKDHFYQESLNENNDFLMDWKLV